MEHYERAYEDICHALYLYKDNPYAIIGYGESGAVLEPASSQEGEWGSKALKPLEILESVKALKNNEVIAIFPEGTRNGLEKNGKAKNGAAYMAIKTGVPVIPVGIHGTFKPFSKVYIHYGEPIDLKEYQGQDKIDEATKLIMDRIVMLTKQEN